MRLRWHAARDGECEQCGGKRAFMEPRFRYDFSQVRVLADSAAGSAAQAIHARAYTHGHNIVFGAGE
jgi:Domain of unknown function (DUF4157)